jgi:hypothetical protein
MNKNEFLPTSKCAECKGKCCKRMGCEFSPSDFDEITFECLDSKISGGNISIDWWDGDVEHGCTYDRIPYLRMRNKNSPIVDPAWNGECILLTDSGCPLLFEDRPLGARALKPEEDGCKTFYTKEDCVRDWRPFVHLLEELITKWR